MSEADVHAYASARRFHPATLSRWLAEPAPDRDALLAVARQLRLGENQFRDLHDDASDIAARAGGGIAAVLSAAAVREALAGRRGRNDAIRALKQALHRLRCPQLAEIETRLAALLRRLALPAGVRAELPAHLEGEHLAVTLRAASAPELRAQATALAAAVQDPAVDEIFALLEGEW